MERREFITLGAGLGISANLKSELSIVGSREKPFNLNFAPHFRMFEGSAGKELLDQLQFMHDQGFNALEDNSMMGREIAMQTAIGNKLSQLGMKMGVFVVSFDGWPPKTTLASGDKAWREKFLETCKNAVEVAKRVNAQYMTVVPGNFDRSIPEHIQMANVVESLKQAADIFEPHGLTMVLEPLSDNPDLYLRFSDQTFMICKSVDSPSCKILFDIYHMQRNEGRLAYHIDQCWDEIAYFQIGDEPGRKEPSTGEINYKFLLNYINKKALASGKDFIYGMEHGNFYPGKEGEQKLIQAYRLVDV